MALLSSNSIRGRIANPTLKGNIGRCLLIFLAVVTSHAASAPQSIPWMSDYAAALEKAHNENKPVFIDFTAEWCSWCKRLDEEVYADASIVNVLKDFVCIKIDVDRQSNVALAYNAQFLPRTIVLNVHDEIVGDVSSYMPLGQFLEFLSGLKEDLTRKTGGMTKPEVRESATPVEPQRPTITIDTPEEEIIAVLGDRDPAVRSEALRVIGEKPEKLRILVAALSSEVLGTRITALEALRKSGVPDMKFDPWATKDERAAALAEWKRWADQNPAVPPPDAKS